MAERSGPNDIVSRFTSRKFILAVSTFVVAVLSATGVIDGSAEFEVAGFIAAGLYIIVEGARDVFGD